MNTDSGVLQVTNVEESFPKLAPQAMVSSKQSKMVVKPLGPVETESTDLLAARSRPGQVHSGQQDLLPKYLSAGEAARI